MAFLVGGANSAADTAYNIENSVRYNQTDTPKLNFTPGSDCESRQTMTWSFWCKRGVLNGTGGYMFCIALDDEGAGFNPVIRFNDSGVGDTLRCTFHNESTPLRVITNRTHRDVSAWYHIVVALDTTQGTASNRIKLYINGTQETSFSEAYYGTEDDETNWGKGGRSFDIGWMDIASEAATSKFFDGYLADFYYINAQQLAASNFGETDEDSGIWKPKKYTGSYNSDSWFLEFKETGTGADSSGIGADTSGEDNHFTVANLAAIDITTDTPTNNFATLNSLFGSLGTYSEGNTRADSNNTSDKDAVSTFAVSKGKWYWEAKIESQGGRNYIGVTDGHDRGLDEGSIRSSPAAMTLFSGFNGEVYSETGTVNANMTASWSDDDIVCFAWDGDNGNMWVTINANVDVTGTGLVTGITTGNAFHVYYNETGSSPSEHTTNNFNFGNPSFTISSGNADGDGYGNFEYAVPSNYYSLCTKNLNEYG